MDPICYNTIEDIPPILTPCALSIGTFDGVHLGHQSLCRALQESRLPTVLLVFTHPPHQIIRQDPHFPGLILSLALRERLLRSVGIDHLIFLHFSHAISRLSYDSFLNNLRHKIPFASLILGDGALLGHERQGTPQRLQSLAVAEGWALSYVPKVASISSTNVRTLIQTGSLSEVKALLGRPYSLLFPPGCADFAPTGLVLPPPGRYPLQGLEQKLLIRHNRTVFLCNAPSLPEALWVQLI